MTESLRVLVVSDMPPLPVTGGGERALWQISSGLAQRGHRVTLLARSGSGEAPASRTVEGVDVRVFEADRRSPLRLVRSTIREARRLAGEEIARGGCDVIHVHQPVAGYGVLRSREAGTRPSLYTLHSPAPLEYRVRRGTSEMHRGGLSGLIGSRALRYVEGACLARVTRIHVLSEYSARLLRGLYGISRERIDVIPGGVDLARFHPAPDRPGIRRSLGLPEGRPLLLTVRNLEPRMGLDGLLRAAALLLPRVPDFLLVIGGAGILRASLEALSAELGLGEHVRFLGFVPEPDLPRHYQAADLFLLPTTALEGFGLVTVEALACGTPVVGTTVGATPEILESLDPSLLFESAEPAAMAARLAAILDRKASEPSWTSSLRDACARYVARHYSWDASVDLLEACLADLAATRAPAMVP